MRAPFLIPAVLILLAGCTALDDLDRRLTGTLAPAAPTAMPTADAPARPLPERKPAAPAQASPPPAPREAAKPAAGTDGAGEAEAPPRSSRLPAELAGLSAADLRALLGPPTARIEEPPGVIWRYRLPDCALDIHLFPRVETQGLFALDASAEGLPPAECIARLSTPRPRPSTGGPAAAAAPAATGDRQP